MNIPIRCALKNHEDASLKECRSCKHHIGGWHRFRCNYYYDIEKDKIEQSNTRIAELFKQKSPHWPTRNEILQIIEEVNEQSKMG